MYLYYLYYIKNKTKNSNYLSFLYLFSLIVRQQTSHAIAQLFFPNDLMDMKY